MILYLVVLGLFTIIGVVVWAAMRNGSPAPTSPAAEPAAPECNQFRLVFEASGVVGPGTAADSEEEERKGEPG